MRALFNPTLLRFGWWDLAFNLARKEIKLRHLGAVLGMVWSLGNPLAVTLTYFFVFTLLMPSGQDRFALHLVTGVFHWMLIAQVLPQSCDWLIGNANLIRKIYFPRILLPLAGMLTICSFWLAAMLVYFCMYQFLGGRFTVALYWYPYVVCCFISFIVGLGLVLCVAQVGLRDLRHLVDVMLPLLFWLTPIVWSDALVPADIRPYLQVNPLRPFFEIFTEILFHGNTPQVTDLFQITALAVTSMSIGVLSFRRTPRLVESL